jgi:peptidoglycan/LPS O-acetylase OafA/YrhL
MVALWIHREIAFRRTAAPWRILEWAGLWSYSLYIIHLPAASLFAMLFPSLFKDSLRWIFLTLFVLAVCYIFYLVVERPGHVIAKKVGRKLGLRNKAIPSTATAF